VYYETVFIVNPDVSQENTHLLTDSLVERVEKSGGRIVKREYWGSRPLAYQISKRKRGHYALLVTDGEPAAINALEQALRLEERVLRFLTTRLQELSDEPSPLLRRKAAAEASTPEKSEEKPAAEAETPTPEKSEEKPAAEAETSAPEKSEEKSAGGDAEA